MRELRTKVVGVTHDNEDGTNRQRHIRKCRKGDSLSLRHNPENPHDSCAVEVHHERGFFFATSNQIGFIRRDLAPEIVGYLDAGGRIDCEIMEVTGGTWTKPDRGVNIKIRLH